jgi:adapter protein MecA 1/2
MSNSVETQDLFLNVLEEAEEKIGFITKDHKIKIEALAMADGDFVLTITRFGKKEETIEDSQNIKSKKIKVKRKANKLNSEHLVYLFNTFDDFCLFSSYVQKINKFTTISKSTVLYTYNSKYYLVFSKLNLNHPYIKKFYTFITEFASYVHNSDLFYYKLSERGTILLKNNAIKSCQKYFNTK